MSRGWTETCLIVLVANVSQPLSQILDRMLLYGFCWCVTASWDERECAAYRSACFTTQASAGAARGAVLRNDEEDWDLMRSIVHASHDVDDSIIKEEQHESRGMATNRR